MKHEERIALCNEALVMMQECFKVLAEQTAELIKVEKEAIRELARRRGTCYTCFMYPAEERYGGICENCFDLEYSSWLDDVLKEEVV